MKISNGFFAACALLLCFEGPARAQDATADTVVATVNGVNITLGHVIVLRESLPEQYQSLPDEMLYNGLVEQLIQQVALEQTMGDTLAQHDQLRIENDRRNYLSGVVLQKVVTEAVTDETVKAAYDARVKNATPLTE